MKLTEKQIAKAHDAINAINGRDVSNAIEAAQAGAINAKELKNAKKALAAATKAVDKALAIVAPAPASKV